MQTSATELRMKRPLPERLRTLADMIQLGEKISWGTDQEIMREAAAELDAALVALTSLQHAIESEGYWVMVYPDTAKRTIEKQPTD